MHGGYDHHRETCRPRLAVELGSEVVFLTEGFLLRVDMFTEFYHLAQG
jgi:hypothetical protein